MQKMCSLDSPTEDNTKSFGTITVRRSMRIANKKRFVYTDMLISSKDKQRDLLKMEISPSRQLRNLTIEARHTLSLQESKKKRLKFEQSLFLPNNKKRKDVLEYFNRKSVNSRKTKEIPNNLFLNSNKLNKGLAPNKFSYDSDFSSESSEQSDKSFPMKRNLFDSKKECNEEFVATEAEEAGPTEKNTFPSYVAYRTKGNKLKLVQNKVDESFPAMATEHQSLMQSTTSENESKAITEKAESPKISNGSENPSISNIYSTDLKAQDSTGIGKSMFSPSNLIDVTQKSQSIEIPPTLTQPARKPPCQSGQSNKLIDQQTSIKVINKSPNLPSNSSKSMEFLMQSSASSESATHLSEPSSITHNNAMATFSKNKPDQPTASEGSYLMKATSPKPLNAIVSNQKLPIKFSPNTPKLIQDAKVQSSTVASHLKSYNEWIKKAKSNDVIVSTSITEKQDQQSVPTERQPLRAPSTIEYNLQNNCTQVSYNKEDSIEQAINELSAQNQVLNSNSKIQDILNLKRHFEGLSQQIQIVEDGSRTASPSFDRAIGKQQCIHNESQTTLMGTLKPRSNLHGQINSNGQLDLPSIGLNPQNNSPRVCKNQKTTTQQPQTQQLNIMQDMPNCSRYFTPFYLQRPVVSVAETTPSTSFVRPSAEEEQSKNAVTTNRRKKRPLKTSNNTQGITHISTHLHRKKTSVEAHGKNVQYPQTFNHQTGATEQISSHLPTHAPDQNNHIHMHSRNPYTTPSKTNQGTSIESQQPETISANSTAPAFHSHPYCSLFHPPFPDFLRNQHGFPPFQAIPQQNMHAHHNVPNASDFQHSPRSVPNPNICGYPPRNESSIGHETSHQPYHSQSYFPGLQSLQHSPANQTRTRNEFNPASNNCRNFHPPNLVNDDIMRYHLSNQNQCWEQNRPFVAPQTHPNPELEQRPVDTNNWLNDRFQQAMRPPDRNERPTWSTRPHEHVKPISTSPVNMDSWVRARSQQVARPPELTNEQRITQLEAVVHSFSNFVDNFRNFNNSLGLTAEAVPPPPPVTRQSSQPWQQSMRISSPCVRNITTQPVPDSRNAWGEYNNPMANMEMENNAGYPRSNAASVHSRRMDGNTANQHPISQQILSHQINAADSTTGGNTTSCLDLRSYRPTQHYNQSHPHHTSESFKNQYTYTH